MPITSKYQGVISLYWAGDKWVAQDEEHQHITADCNPLQAVNELLILLKEQDAIIS